MHSEDRLRAAGLALPPIHAPSGNYIPFRRDGNMLFVSGQGPKRPDGPYITGKARTAGDVPQGYAAAELAALNLIATVKLAVGDLGKVKSVLKILGMVNASEDFLYHPQVINGCSDILIKVFGEDGKHPRSAVGMSSLPHGIIVEVEGIFSLKE